MIRSGALRMMDHMTMIMLLCGWWRELSIATSTYRMKVCLTLKLSNQKVKWHHNPNDIEQQLDIKSVTNHWTSQCMRIH